MNDINWVTTASTINPKLHWTLVTSSSDFMVWIWLTEYIESFLYEWLEHILKRIHVHLIIYVEYIGLFHIFKLPVENAEAWLKIQELNELLKFYDNSFIALRADSINNNDSDLL